MDERDYFNNALSFVPFLLAIVLVIYGVCLPSPVSFTKLSHGGDHKSFEERNSILQLEPY